MYIVDTERRVSFAPVEFLRRDEWVGWGRVSDGVQTSLSKLYTGTSDVPTAGVRDRSPRGGRRRGDDRARWRLGRLFAAWSAKVRWDSGASIDRFFVLRHAVKLCRTCSKDFVGRILRLNYPRQYFSLRTLNRDQALKRTNARGGNSNKIKKKKTTRVRKRRILDIAGKDDPAKYGLITGSTETNAVRLIRLQRHKS